MKLSLLSKSPPFSQLETFKLNRTSQKLGYRGYCDVTYFMPATYAKVTTAEEE